VKVLVTGGSGFIGTNLVQELQSRGHNVMICDLLNNSLENYYRCDVSKIRHLENIFEKHQFDFVYHLAAEYGRWNGEDYYENLWSTNVIGTKNMTKMQEKYKFKMIAFSSSEVYGDFDGVMKEDVMDKFEIKQMNDYAMTKWVNEMQVVNAAEMYDTETVRVRPINCYGPHEHYTPYRGFVPKFIYSILFDKPYTVYSKHTRTIDFVKDTCRTFANIIDNFIPGEVYNVGGIKETSVKYVSDFIVNYLNKDDSQITYEDFEPFTTKNKIIDNSKAIRDLDHKPVTTPEEGIIKTIEWFKKQYGID
jgi:dTDP-glucose 4,6-dehydratase